MVLLQNIRQEKGLTPRKQGSKLGPTLYNIYTSDMPTGSALTTTILYADDTLVYFTSIHPVLATVRVQLRINELH